MPAAPRDLEGVASPGARPRTAAVDGRPRAARRSASPPPATAVALARDGRGRCSPGRCRAEVLRPGRSGRRPRLQVASAAPAGGDRACASTPSSRPTCIDPGRQDYRLDDLLEESAVELAGGGRATRAARAGAAPRPARCGCATRLAERLEDTGWTTSTCASSCRSSSVLARHGARRRGRSTRARMGEIAAQASRSRATELEARAHELAGRAVRAGLAQAARRGALRASRAPRRPQGQDRLLDRRASVLARIRGPAPDRGRGRGVARAHEAARDLSRAAPRAARATTAACTPRSRRRRPRRDGSRRSSRTCRTSRCARRSGARSARRSSPPRAARLLSVDYSQVELRILAHLSGEELLRDAFARGDDIHAVTAAEVLGKPIETLTQGRAQPGQGGQLRDHLRHLGLRPVRAARHRARRGPGLHRPLPRAHAAAWRRSSSARSRSPASAATSTTLLGRRRPVPELRAQNWQVRSLGERLAVNSVIQGSAADIIKLAMIRIHRRLREEGLRLAPGAADPRRAAARGARRRDRHVRELVLTRWSAAYELDPPLAVDAGVGETTGSRPRSG